MAAQARFAEFLERGSVERSVEQAARKQATVELAAVWEQFAEIPVLAASFQIESED